MSDRFEIKTRFTKEQIESQVIFPKVQDLIQHSSKIVINLQEEEIRQALITLGWTPPNSEGIQLSKAIPLPIMIEVMTQLAYYKDRNLSYFLADADLDGQNVVLLGVYPKEDRRSSFYSTVMMFQNKSSLSEVEALARNLNTLFKLSPPSEGGL